MKLKTLMMSGAATALILSATTASAEELRFWTTEEQPERLALQEQMAADFSEASGHSVDVIPVTESDLGTRATAAYAAGDLPDVIYHTLQYALPWAEAGILDTDAATDVIEALGADTFAPGALNMAATMDGKWRLPGRARRCAAAGRGRHHRGVGVLQGHRGGVPSGRSVLGPVPLAVFCGRCGDDHLVAVHSG